MLRLDLSDLLRPGKQSKFLFRLFIDRKRSFRVIIMVTIDSSLC